MFLYDVQKYLNTILGGGDPSFLLGFFFFFTLEIPGPHFSLRKPTWDEGCRSCTGGLEHYGPDDMPTAVTGAFPIELNKLWIMPRVTSLSRSSQGLPRSFIKLGKGAPDIPFFP